MEATTIVLVVVVLGALIAGIWALWYFFLRKPSEKDVRIYQAEERLSWLKVTIFCSIQVTNLTFSTSNSNPKKKIANLPRRTRKKRKYLPSRSAYGAVITCKNTIAWNSN